jgi:hypothetical protein
MTAVIFPDQFGDRTPPPLTYSGIKAMIPRSNQGQSTMPITLTSGTVKTIIAGLFALVCTLIGAIYFSMVGDIGTIKKDMHELSTKVDTNHVELIKSIGAVEKQAVAANSRLDGILQELQRQRR